METRYKVKDCGFGGGPVICQMEGERRASTIKLKTRYSALGFNAIVSVEKWDALSETTEGAKTVWLKEMAERVEHRRQLLATAEADLIKAKAEIANLELSKR